MKKMVCFFLLAVALVGVASAQLRKIPSSVTGAFTSRYPYAEKVEWSDKLTSFVASFVLNGAELKAGFSNNGEWKYSERKLMFGDLPADVKDGFSKSKYSDWGKGAVTEIETSGKSVEYRIAAEKSFPFQKKRLYFDSSGRLLRDVIAL